MKPTASLTKFSNRPFQRVPAIFCGYLLVVYNVMAKVVQANGVANRKCSLRQGVLPRKDLRPDPELRKKMQRDWIRTLGRAEAFANFLEGNMTREDRLT